MTWGVDTLLVQRSTSTDDIVEHALRAAQAAGYVEPGDIAVVLAGSPTGLEPATDTLRLVRIR
jgi:pyruvate kinase